ncbi:MAG: sodium:solute symporter family protein [Sedimentisphaerales bacterium]|nr:sodium:solute symporter family protein [Sedimentisphaerales bacterium]
MFGLSAIDIIVIVLYFSVVIGIGLWSARRIKDSEDYFLAGRRFGKFIQTFAAFGQGTSADNAVGVTTTTFTNGIAGVWSSLLYLVATPMYWLVMPWMRRLRVLTLGDFFEERYGSKAIAGVYAIIGSIGMMTIISVGFAAMTKTVVALSPKPLEALTEAERAEYDRAVALDQLNARDYNTLTPEQKDQLHELSLQKPRRLFSHIDANILIWIVCGVVLVYAVAGGLEAAFLTDALQGVFIIVLSVLLFPFAWSKINATYGGAGPLDALTTVHAQLPESFFEIFGSPTAMDFTWYYIAALTVMVTVNVVIQPNSLVATASAKGEYECRFGFVAGSYMKRLCTILWGFFALSAVVLYHDQVHDPDLVWGYATLDLLGPLHLGLVGLMIACLMAALMSTADCLMITGSSLLTQNIYRPLFPGRPERHYVAVGRWFGALVVVGGALIALQFDTILQQLKLWWELNVMVAASFWLGMKWRRANRIGAWCSILATAILFFGLPILLPALVPSLRTQPALLKSTRQRTIVRTYRAREMDILQRDQEIERWQALSAQEREQVERPLPLEIGQAFEKTYRHPSRSIFWTKGIKQDREGQAYGSGMLSLELVALDRLGFELEDNPYALNETLRILIRTLVPFLVLIGVALLTRPDAADRLDRFYAKMKTPVLRDPQADAEALAGSLAQPDALNDRKLFPHASWELDKWTRTDFWGFVVSCLMAAAVVGLLVLLTRIGGS